MVTRGAVWTPVVLCARPMVGGFRDEEATHLRVASDLYNGY